MLKQFAIFMLSMVSGVMASAAIVPQPTSQPVTQPTIQPTATVAVEPSTQPTTQANVDATTQPTTTASIVPTTEPTTQAAAAERSTAATSKVVAVTVYQSTALVTREVQVREGPGVIELLVGPLPPQTIDSSLYTEGSDGLRILTTQFRTRAVKEDTREAVRNKEQEIRDTTASNDEIQDKLEMNKQNAAMLSKLENFTSATLLTMTDKGMLNADSTLKLATFLMQTRSSLGASNVELQHQLQANNNSLEFLRRQLTDLAAGGDRTEREAVIIVDKANVAGGIVRLNYLVSSANWKPQYKLRASGEKDPVTVEYLASIEQQTGEDWSSVDLVLSTAQPMLNAAPPALLALDVDVSTYSANAAANSNSQAAMNKLQSYAQARQLRAKAQKDLTDNNNDVAQSTLNSAAATEQFAELLAADEPGQQVQAVREGPSVAYHLTNKLTIPSRNDQQFVEIARIELEPTYFYKTVPVISLHVYRQAELVNKSKYVLLPGEATMYVGTDFVGRMALPLVAIGENFVAGFGVDPQIQVERQLVGKNHTVQGGNQVQSYSYRIRVNSFKANDVALQVWDRLPHPETESVAVELVKTSPDLSSDGEYLRGDRLKNLLRWDLQVKGNTSAETASTVTYDFKLQYARDVSIGNFSINKK